MNQEISRSTLMALSLVSEGILLLIAAVWIYFGQINLIQHFHSNRFVFIYGFLCAAITLSLTLFSLYLSKRLKIFEGMRKFSEEFLVPLLSVLNFWDITLLSLISGFCEEILFRGIFQDQFGIFIASLCFGFFHDPSLKQRSYVLYCCLAGFLLGYTYQITSSLWACIMAHSLHNWLTILFMRYRKHQT